MISLIERLLVGKRLCEVGSVPGLDGRVHVLVIERHGEKRVVIKTSAPGSVRYTSLAPDSIASLSALLEEAREAVLAEAPSLDRE